MECLNRRSFRHACILKLPFCLSQVSECSRNSLRRAGDDGRKKASDTGRKHYSYRAGDLFVRSRRIVVINACEAVNLHIDEARRYIVFNGRRRNHLVYGLNRIIEGNFIHRSVPANFPIK